MTPPLPPEVPYDVQQVLMAMGVCPHCGKQKERQEMHLTVFHAHMVSQWHCGCLQHLEAAWIVNRAHIFAIIEDRERHRGEPWQPSAI
jgi:hypothetical protein